MSALSAKEKKQIKDLVIILNSSDMFKYPIGNKKLYEMTIEFESIGYIKYCDKFKKWIVR